VRTRRAGREPGGTSVSRRARRRPRRGAAATIPSRTSAGPAPTDRTPRPPHGLLEPGHPAGMDQDMHQIPHPRRVIGSGPPRRQQAWRPAKSRPRSNSAWPAVRRYPAAAFNTSNSASSCAHPRIARYPARYAATRSSSPSARTGATRPPYDPRLVHTSDLSEPRIRWSAEKGRTEPIIVTQVRFHTWPRPRSNSQPPLRGK
jgi:hypothetical protein